MFPPCIPTFHVGYISLTKVYLIAIVSMRQSSWLCLTKSDVAQMECGDTFFFKSAFLSHYSYLLQIVQDVAGRSSYKMRNPQRAHPHKKGGEGKGKGRATRKEGPKRKAVKEMVRQLNR